IVDRVRILGNYSSGKMGFSLADECTMRGAQVILVAGPVQRETRYPLYRRVDVESAAEMLEAAVSLFPRADAAILCAAVADYTPVEVAEQKMKREERGLLTIQMQPTADIAARLGEMKAAAPHPKVLVGFALETEEEEANALSKLSRKHFDFIVLNSLNDVGAGFRVDTNKITILDGKTKVAYPLKPKVDVAADIVDRLVKSLDHPEATR
ncbi:MAG: phosphopantothenoylcysteine decarboxylase, partial [Prevotellaceae bacterium]|nr:phosphopantothenoylcysteine decarboxylase [Prevotellaceae bacterium]